MYHDQGEGMFNKLLVPLDGSKTAEKALPYARYLAQDKNVVVELLAVVDVANMASHMTAERALHLDTMVDDAVRASEKYLQAVAATLTAAKIKTVVDSGRPEEVIIEKAAADQDTLITMATHGRSGMNRWLLGSVAEKVVHGANNAVLVVRANHEMTSEGEAAPDSIIVPLDGSSQAESVLLYVVELARAFHAKVTLLRAYSLKQIIFSFEQYHPDLDGLKDALRWEAKTYLDEKVAQLKSRSLVDVFCSATEGDAPETIIEMGKGAPRTLIAMSTHGGSMIKHWVLGSVTEKVLRHANNAVLIIRT